MQNYLELIKKLLAENKTTGTNHAEDMLNYTRLNLQRMERWLKTVKINAETETIIKNISSPQKWVVLTEAWCGDAAHSMPVLYLLSKSNPLIEFEWKLRDENLELMDQYLTNGGRSIPKLIVYNQNGEELFNWGPRPKHIQEKYLEMRKNNLAYTDINIELQKLYNEDKAETIQKEMTALLTRVTTKN